MRRAGPRGGTYTIPELLAKYDDIISGKATPVKLDAIQTAQRKKAQYEVISTKIGKQVIVPHAANETVKVVNGNVEITHPAGIVRTQLPVDYQNLSQYLTDIKKHRKEINKMKEEGKSFAFSFYGGRHVAIYDDIGKLISTLQKYEGIQSAIRKGDTKTMHDMFRHLEIVQSTSPAWAKQAKEPPNKRARKHREFRAKMSPEEREKYRADARARAKKSRERKK